MISHSQLQSSWLHFIFLSLIVLLPCWRSSFPVSLIVHLSFLPRLPAFVDLMVILWSPKEYLSLKFLKCTALLGFLNNLIPIDPDLSWHIVGTYCPLGRFYSMVLPLRFFIPHKYIFFQRIFKENSFLKSSIC